MKMIMNGIHRNKLEPLDNSYQEQQNVEQEIQQKLQQPHQDQQPQETKTESEQMENPQSALRYMEWGIRLRDIY